MAGLAVAIEARRLIRAAGMASLGTVRDGQPFVSLVTPATAPDLSPLLFLSSLAEHTRHLLEDPRCSLLFTGSSDQPNPQTIPRVTLTAEAERLEGEAAAPLKARWLGRHPYAALYAGFADFALWRLRITGALVVGGFARAVRLRPDQLLPEPDSVAAIAAAEAEITVHMNADHPTAVSAMACGLLRQPPGDWRMVAVDVDGVDLAMEESACRMAFSAPVSSSAAVRHELVRAAAEGRAALR